MAVSIEYLSAFFKLTGDGSATSAQLSLLEYPFVGSPNGHPISAFINADGGGHITAVSTSGNAVTLTFDSAFSSQTTAIQIGLNYNL
jgi:hypothetical protein